MGIYKVKGKKGEIWYIDLYVDGRRIRKAVGSKKDAENALAATKADVLRGEFRFKRDHRIKFEDFADKYIEYGETNKKRSLERDRYSVKKLKSQFKDFLFSKITSLQIEEYKKKRLEKVKPATLNRELACLRHMFNLAIKWKMTDENPVKDVEFPEEQEIEMRILNREEADRLIEAAPDYLKPIIVIALNTGMRRGEILGLRWDDIDFNQHYIYIKQTKSGVPRKIPMNSLVVGVLKSVKREDRFVFYNSKTKNHLKYIHYGFKKACEKIGIPDLRFHDLRHSAATLMVTGGVDLVTVKEILGHSKIEMTMKYAHPTPENKRKAVSILGTIFEGKAQETKSIQIQGEIGLDHKDKLITPIPNN